ncbi:MAG: MmcQ/YjbR family DNA-binding protein [Flavobacteriaceae bacterium]|nr:MmcQ/YjbR family DNA-binding protein [Flavobacteriaceae bacterium]
MNIEAFRDFCLFKKGVTEAFPFDKDTLVFKVKNKIFALTSLSKWEEGEYSINLKCDPNLAIKLREKYPDDVSPGYHMNKKHWNTVTIHYTQLSEKYIEHLINHSYELVVSKLPKITREELNRL